MRAVAVNGFSVYDFVLLRRPCLLTDARTPYLRPTRECLIFGQTSANNVTNSLGNVIYRRSYNTLKLSAIHNCKRYNSKRDRSSLGRFASVLGVELLSKEECAPRDANSFLKGISIMKRALCTRELKSFLLRLSFHIKNAILG